MQWHRDGYTIDTDRERLDFEVVIRDLQTTYWASKRSADAIECAWRNSVLVFGLYRGDEQLGFARVVSDLVAIGCAETLLAQGLKIPADISLVGFGNILLAEFYRVPLTTMRQPKFRLGIAAMEAMMSLLRGEQIQTKRLGAEIVERKSTAPPRTT